MLAACAHKEPPPLTISNCRIEATPLTMYATLENISGKTIVSTGLNYRLPV